MYALILNRMYLPKIENFTCTTNDMDGTVTFSLFGISKFCTRKSLYHQAEDLIFLQVLSSLQALSSTLHLYLLTCVPKRVFYFSRSEKQIMTLLCVQINKTATSKKLTLPGRLYHGTCSF